MKDHSRLQRCNKKILFIAGLVLVSALFMGSMAFAGVVLPVSEAVASNYRSDRQAIQAELDWAGSVTLQEGKTYHLDAALRVRSNYSIDATGATIVLEKAAVRNNTSDFKTGYNSLSNVTVKGGKWIPANSNGTTGTTFSFAHSSNIQLLNLDIECTNQEYHAIELVGCKNVLIQGCTIIAQGTGKAKSVEEMVQIDLATPLTAPFLGSAFQNGLACDNIRVIGNTITGNRAVCCNYAARENKFKKYYHKNIVIKNNVLTGNKAEALALFNTLNATVSNNTIITKSSRVKEAYSIGLHVSVFGKIKAFKKKGNITVTNNIIKGGRQAFFISSHAKNTSFKKLTIKNNRLYCKKGKKMALGVSSVKKVKKSKNKTYKWK